MELNGVSAGYISVTNDFPGTAYEAELFFFNHRIYIHNEPTRTSLDAI